MINIKNHWLLEKILLGFGACFAVAFILLNASFDPVEGSQALSVANIAFFTFSIFIVVAITLLPYYVYYQFAKRLRQAPHHPVFAKISLALTVLLIPVCCALYVAAGISISEDPSSTAAVIYVVMPVYFALVGGLFYGAVYYIAKFQAKRAARNS